MTPEQKLKKLESLLALVDESLTREEFVENFTKVVEHVKRIEKKTDDDVSTIRTTLTALGEKLKTDSTSSLAELKSSVETRLNKAISSAFEEQNKTLSFVRDSVRRLTPGKDGINGVNGRDGTDGLNGSPDTPEEIVDKLESLVGDERLDKSAIRGLEELIAEAIKNGKHVEVKGSSRGLFVSVDGVETGIIQNVNLVAGSGMNLTYMQVNGQDTIVFEATGGGGGTTPETPVEVPDGIITVFTVSEEPQYMIADGASFFDGQGYTYAALQVTFVNPPTQYVRAMIA